MHKLWGKRRYENTIQPYIFDCISFSRDYSHHSLQIIGVVCMLNCQYTYACRRIHTHTLGLPNCFALHSYRWLYNSTASYAHVCVYVYTGYGIVIGIFANSYVCICTMHEFVLSSHIHAHTDINKRAQARLSGKELENWNEPEAIHIRIHSSSVARLCIRHTVIFYLWQVATLAVLIKCLRFGFFHFDCMSNIKNKAKKYIHTISVCTHIL